MGTRIAVTGWGAVSPAGWGVDHLSDAVSSGQELPIIEIGREGKSRPAKARKVPPPEKPFAFLRDPRLRRTSVIGRYGVAAALEALGDKRQLAESGQMRTGVIFCEMNGIVDYSRRFYTQVLDDPAFASPILFPETVYNAPSSHLSALLGSTEINYTTLGDSSEFVAGLDIAARWLTNKRVDACLVVAAEELDWLSAEAFQMFEPDCPVAEGAAALLLERRESSLKGEVELTQLAGPVLYKTGKSGGPFPKQRLEIGKRLREEIELAESAKGTALLIDGKCGGVKLDPVEKEIWQGWPGNCISPQVTAGAAFSVGAGWQCAIAARMLACNDSGHSSAVISAIGGNQQAAAAVLGIE